MRTSVFTLATAVTLLPLTAAAQATSGNAVRTVSVTTMSRPQMSQAARSAARRPASAGDAYVSIDTGANLPPDIGPGFNGTGWPVVGAAP